MATGDIIIRIRGDSRDFQADIGRAQRRLKDLAGSANQADKALHSSAGAIAKFKSAMADTAMYGGSAALLMGFAAIPGKLREAADAYTDIQSKLKLATTSTDELAVANERLFKMSQNNRVAFADTVQLYSGIAMPLKDAGKSQEEILKFTDLVGKGLQVSGSSAGEAASTIKQLSQAMASGVLRGDEFNSIMENGKAISMALAEGLGTTTGKLREMAEKGMLKSELVFNALMSQAEDMTQKFKQIAPTMEKVWVTIGNAAVLEVGKIDQATGASAAIAKNLQSVADNMDTVFNGAVMSAGVLSAVLGGKVLSALAGYTASQYAALQATRAGAVAALAAAEADTVQAAAKVRVAEATLIDTAARERRIALQRQDAIAAVAAARGTDAYATALARLNVAHVANAEAQAASVAARSGLTAATTAATASTERLSAAQAANTVTARAWASASAMGASAVGLLGGPAGAVMVGAIAVYYMAEAFNESAKSITLANGQTLAFGEAIDHVTDLSNEYRDASRQRQDAIREEIDNIIKLTQQRKLEAKQQLDYLNQLDADTASNGSHAGANSLKKVWADMFGLDQGEARAAIKETTATLDELTKKQGDLGKSAEELAPGMQKTSAAYEEAARAALGATDATKKATDVTVRAGQVLHGHGDTIKSLVEGLQQQRIELQHGKDAADYYAKRLQGLTDTEARAAIGAQQYNTYLAERKKINLDAAETVGGLRDKYIANLDAMGLTTGKSATQGIDAAKSATDRVVKASDQYRISIDEATEALKRQADAAKAVLVAASTPVVPDAAGTIAAGAVTPSTGGKADASLTKKMQLAATINPSTMAAISSVSKSSGLDPTMMKAMAWIESNFNAKARNKSSASGVYQFVDKTAAAYGLSGKQFDPVANTQAYVRLLNDNMKALKQYGLEVNSANLYLAHQQGADGLKQITNEAKGYGRADATVHKNMAGNPSGYAKDGSAAEFLRGWREKFAVVEASARALSGETGNMLKDGMRGLADEASKVAPSLAKSGATSLLSGLFPVVGAVAESARSTFKGVATEAGKVAKEAGLKGVEGIAPAAAKAIPIWDELSAKTQKIADIAVEYKGTIDATRVTEEQRNALIDDYMSNQAKELIKSAQDQRKQVEMTGAAYRDWQLTQDKFLAGDKALILAEEQLTNFTKERVALLADAAQYRAGGGSEVDKYRQGLSNANLDKSQVEQLAGLKMQNLFDAEKSSLEALRKEAALTDDSYRKWQLTMQTGLTPAMADQLIAEGKQVAQMGALHAAAQTAFDSIGDAILDTAFEGKANWEDMIKSMIKESLKLKIIKPWLDNMMNGGSVTGGAGSASGGGIFASLGKLMGFATGGAFDVGGAGGIDSQVVAFRATPGERVIVQTPGQQGGGGVNISMPISIDARGADAGSVERIQSAISSMESRIYRNIPGVVRQAQIRNRVSPNV